MKLSAQVRATHDQDGSVVLDILHGQIFRTNIVGSRILKLLEQDHTEKQIAEELAGEFGVSRELAEGDVQEFLGHLIKHQLLEFRPSELPPAL